MGNGLSMDSRYLKFDSITKYFGKNILWRKMLKEKNISCTSHSDNISYCNTFTLNAWTQPLSIKGWIQKCEKKYITGMEIKRKKTVPGHTVPIICGSLPVNFMGVVTAKWVLYINACIKFLVGDKRLVFAQM